MTWSGFRSLLLAALVGVALAGCGTNQETTTIPTPVQVTDTFTGMITPAGTVTFAFTAKTGAVTVTLVSLSPDHDVKLSMAIGTYSPYYLTCSPVTANTSIGEKGIMEGLTTATTSICIQLSDPAGAIPTPTGDTFTITAVHY